MIRFENIKSQNKKNLTLEPTNELLSQKQSYLKANKLTSLLEKRSKDFIPYVFPVALIHKKDFKNISEKNRYEKITDLFLKLKVYLETNEAKEMAIAKEFFIKHGIYDREYFTFERLANFIKFIRSGERDNIWINPTKSLKDIIIDASLNYNSSKKIKHFYQALEYNTENKIYKNYNQSASNNHVDFNYYKIQNDSQLDGGNSKDVSNSNVCQANKSISNLNGLNSNNNINISYNNNTAYAASNFSSNSKLPYVITVGENDKEVNNKQRENKDNQNYKSMANDYVYSKRIYKPTKLKNLNFKKFSLMHSNEKNLNIINQNNSISDKLINANYHPILNEKIYKIEYNNPQKVIDNLEPEIAKIKGSSIYASTSKLSLKSYSKPINNSKKKTNGKFSNSIQFPADDLDQIKKKNKLLEYIVLQRSKNKLNLENNKKLFDLEN